MAVLKKQPGKAFLLLLFFLVSGPAVADPLPPAHTGSQPVAEGRVSGQKNPTTLMLADGRLLSPALIAPQDLPALLPGLNGQLLRAYGANTPDRYGRLPVQILLPAPPVDRWWQAEAVRAGLARVWSSGPRDETLTLLLREEDSARQDRRGHWQEPDWQPVCAESPDALTVGAFALIQGQVRRATLRQGTLWLDFGEHWRTDTSATLPAPVLKALPKDWRQPAFWTGRLIEIRGWVQGGPRLDLTGPGQIRLLPSDRSPCQSSPLKNGPLKN